MRAKNKLFLKLILLVIVLICVIGIFVFTGFNKKEVQNNYIKEEITLTEKETEIEENIINDNELEKEEDLEIVEEKTINTSKNIEYSSSNNNNTSSSSKSKLNIQSNNLKEKTNTQNNTVSNETPIKESKPNVEVPKEEPKQEPVQTKPSEDLTKVANPNEFYYSITGGNVEFNTNAGCMKAGEDIAFIDVVDVQYFRCYEVSSKANTIMGYYLNIFCENGNCNSRYKSMINIKSYD